MEQRTRLHLRWPSCRRHNVTRNATVAPEYRGMHAILSAVKFRKGRAIPPHELVLNLRGGGTAEITTK